MELRASASGSVLQHLVILMVVTGAMALLALPIYQGVADVSSARGHLEGQEDMTRAVEVFHLEHGGLLWDVTEASFASRHDPWNNFALFPSMAPAVAAPGAMNRTRLRFCISVTGRVALDVDGDGLADLSAVGLTNEQRDHIEALGLPMVAGRHEDQASGTGDGVLEQR